MTEVHWPALHCDIFQVDELNLLVIPGLLLLKSYIPWIFSIRLEDLTAAISAHVPPPPFQLIGFAPSAEVMHFSRKCFDSLKMLQSHPERPVTLGFLLLVLSVAFSLFHSTKWVCPRVGYYKCNIGILIELSLRL